MQSAPVGIDGGVIETFALSPVPEYLGREGLTIFEPAPELEETDFADRARSVGFEPAFLFGNRHREFWGDLIRERSIDYDTTDIGSFLLTLDGVCRGEDKGDFCFYWGNFWQGSEVTGAPHGEDDG